MLQNLVNNGYCYFKDPDAFQFLDINTVSWHDKGTIPLQLVKRTPDVEESLDKIQKYLGQKYIRPTFGNYQLHYSELLDGLDPSVYDWHHDSEVGKEKLGFLLYFSDTDIDTGGSLEIRKSNTDHNYTVLYPTMGDKCILHHTPNFEHRVSELKLPIQRIVAIFHYYVENINR
jgi:hypothetical protein